MGNKFYTGIGSRETPQEIGRLMTSFASIVEKMGFILRSGGADGADTFFEQGCSDKEIYIPWNNFNNRQGIVPNITDEKISLLREIHPNFENLKEGAMKLHLRNINQVLGVDLTTPSKFLICWAKTSKGIPTGGTRTAWVLASMYKIPCFNLFEENSLNRIAKFLNYGK